MASGSQEPRSVGEDAADFRFAEFSDLQLRERLRRIQDGLRILGHHLVHLPDGGRKYLASIRAVRLELARRQALPSGNQPAAAEPGAGAVLKVLIVIATQAEMLPLVHRFQLLEAPAHESIFPRGSPWMRYHGNYKGLHIDLVWPGKDPALGVDSIGTLSAALVTYASIQFLKPDLIINAGTASGFEAKGAGIGDVFLASDVAFHDRRLPIPVFDLYGNGARKTFVTPSMLKGLNLKIGKLSTGDSRDMSPDDVLEILSNGATLKDTEGAAVAHVADMFSIPAIFVKAVTEIVDGKKPTAEKFLQNLTTATKALDQAVAEVVNFISGKCLSDH